MSLFYRKNSLFLILCFKAANIEIFFQLQKEFVFFWKEADIIKGVSHFISNTNILF